MQKRLIEISGGMQIRVEQEGNTCSIDMIFQGTHGKQQFDFDPSENKTLQELIGTATRLSRSEDVMKDLNPLRLPCLATKL